MLVNTNIEINSPKPDQVVFYQPWQNKNDKKKKPYPVIINSGDFWVDGRLSNFWYWQRVYKNGKIKKEIEHGYGNFFFAEGYEIRRIVHINK